MFTFLMRRFLTTIITVIVAILLVFALTRMIPGDPVTAMLGTRATPQMIADLHVKMGLDQPIYVQVFRFFINIFHGDFGIDIFSQRPVSTLILDVFPYTVELAVSSMLLAIILGVPLGCYSAAHRNSVADRLTAIMSISLITTPTFVACLFLLLVLGVRLHWFPIIGVGERGNMPDQLWHLVLPSIALALGYIGYFARLIRSSILEVLTEDYIRTARAFGFAERTVVYKHALKNALLPFIAVLAVEFGLFLGGAVFVEIIFCRPGIGSLIYNAVIMRNYPVIQGGMVVTVLAYVLINVLADVFYGVVDPRIRLE